MQCSSRIGACRRGLNSHKAAAPRSALLLHPVLSIRAARSEGTKTERSWSEQRCRRLRKRCLGTAPATSEHCAAWEAIVFSRFVGSHLALARLRTVKARSGSNARRATVASTEQEGVMAAGNRNYEVVAGPGCVTERGLTPRSRRDPTALHLARAAPVVHDAPRGQGAIPLVPPQLER